MIRNRVNFLATIVIQFIYFLNKSINCFIHLFIHNLFFKKNHNFFKYSSLFFMLSKGDMIQKGILLNQM